MLNIYPGK